MAFTVEDGTGVADANSYSTVEWADEYHADRANDDWSFASPAEKQAALIRATDYIEHRWGAAFGGLPEHEGQPLSFPRTCLYNRAGEEVTGIPFKLKAATAEYAVRGLEKSLAPDPEYQDNGLQVTLSREKIGPIETEKQYTAVSSVVKIRAYPAADRLLAEYVMAGTGRVYRG